MVSSSLIIGLVGLILIVSVIILSFFITMGLLIGGTLLFIGAMCVLYRACEGLEIPKSK